MVIDNKLSIRLHYNNIKHYEQKGYSGCTNDIIIISSLDLTESSREKINVICDNCGKDKIIFNHSYNKIFKKHNMYLCKKCVQVEKEKTNLERYGVKNVMNSIDVKEKRISNSIEKFGVTHPCKNEEIKNKIKKTNLERYDVEYSFLNEEIKNKSLQTNLNKYECSCTLNNKDIKEKTFNTMLERYGCKYSMQNNDIKEKIIESNILTIKNKTLNNNEDIINIDYENDIFEVNCNTCCNTFKISPNNYYQRKKYNTIICTICNPIGKFDSGLENDFENFIKSLNIKYKSHDRSILKPNEIDFYLPEYNIAFEFNGLYWHSEIYKEKEYHKIKFKKCLEKNIKLITIYEDDWLFKKDIVKSEILNELYKNDINIYNENYNIIETSFNDIKKILSENSLSYKKGDINLCLMCNEKIISAISFVKKKNNFYELFLNYNKIGYDILMKYFINKYKPTNIIFIDNNDWSSNIINDFTFAKNIKPKSSYIIDRKRENNKTKIVNINNKILKIYNSGYRKFLFKF